MAERLQSPPPQPSPVEGEGEVGRASSPSPLAGEGGEGGAASAQIRPRHPEKVNLPSSPPQRKPDWIRVKAPVSREYQETRALMRRLKLNTVCEEAACPNIGECGK